VLESPSSIGTEYRTALLFGLPPRKAYRRSVGPSARGLEAVAARRGRRSSRATFRALFEHWPGSPILVVLVGRRRIFWPFRRLEKDQLLEGGRLDRRWPTPWPWHQRCSLCRNGWRPSPAPSPRCVRLSLGTTPSPPPPGRRPSPSTPYLPPDPPGQRPTPLPLAHCGLSCVPPFPLLRCASVGRRSHPPRLPPRLSPCSWMRSSWRPCGAVAGLPSTRPRLVRPRARVA